MPYCGTAFFKTLKKMFEEVKNALGFVSEKEVSNEIAKQQTQNNGGNGDMVSSIANSITSIFNGLNYKGQANQIELARIQNETAQTNAQANKKTIPTAVWVVGVVVIVIIGLAIFKRKSA